MTDLPSDEAVKQTIDAYMAGHDPWMPRQWITAYLTATEEGRALVEYKRLYHELIYQISIKHPTETRHETALRYLRSAESQDNPPQVAIAQQEPKT